MEKIGRTKIVDLLKRTDIGAMVNVKGWVRTRRGSKQVNFIALNDGSTINNLQVVVDLANFDEEMLKPVSYTHLNGTFYNLVENEKVEEGKYSYDEKGNTLTLICIDDDTVYCTVKSLSEFALIISYTEGSSTREDYFVKQ